MLRYDTKCLEADESGIPLKLCIFLHRMTMVAAPKSKHLPVHTSNHETKRELAKVDTHTRKPIPSLVE